MSEKIVPATINLVVSDWEKLMKKTNTKTKVEALSVVITAYLGE